jgi:hypothetical protein
MPPFLGVVVNSDISTSGCGLHKEPKVDDLIRFRGMGFALKSADEGIEKSRK